MTSEERQKARFERRKAAREEKHRKKLGHCDDFSRIIDADNLYEAFKKSKRGVSWKESVQRYEASAMRNIAETRRKLLNGENVQRGFVEFIVNERGKTRNIKSVHISEQIIQKCLCDNILVPILSNPLIYDNGAILKGKGVHFSLRRLLAHLLKFYRKNGFSNKGYALQIDFTKYFDNIRHDILLAAQDKYIKDLRVRELTSRFICACGEGKSLGLGSQVSQIAALFYPNQLDHFIKEKLGIKYYGRYVDDLYLIHADKGYLKYCLKEIEALCTSLGIIINRKKTGIVKLEDGLLFLKGKYVLLQTGKVLCLPCKDATRRIRRKLKKLKLLLEKGKMSPHDLRSAYQSWRGNYKKRFHAYYRLKAIDKLYIDLFFTKRV